MLASPATTEYSSRRLSKMVLYQKDINARVIKKPFLAEITLLARHLGRLFLRNNPRRLIIAYMS
jgi:hypothetical protein